MSPGEALLFRTHLLTDPVLRINVLFQKRIYRLVRLYGRKELKEELEAVHRRIFQDESRQEFQRNISQLFTNSYKNENT